MRTLLRHGFPIAGFALAVYAFYPGHLSWDSAFLYWQARTGHYANVAPAALPAAWSVIQSAWSGSGGLFALQLALFTAGVWSVACAFHAGTAQRIAASAYVCLGTPALLVMSHLWTDAAMIACLAAACGLVAHADLRRSRAWLVAAIPLLVCGGLVRHNAVTALVPLAAWWIVVDRRLRRPDAPLRAGTVALAAAVAAGAIFAAGRLIDRMLVEKPVSTFAAVQVFDLAAISVATDEMLLPAFLLPDGFTLAVLRERHVGYNNVPLFLPPAGVKEVLWEWSLNSREREALGAAWRDALLAHPKAYLAHRLAVAGWLFGRYRNDRPRELAFVPRIEPFRDNPPLEANDTSLHRVAVHWYGRAVGWWGYAPVTHLAIAAAVLAVAWRRRSEPAGRFAVAVAASGLAYVAPLPLVAPSAELRYSGWLFVAASLALTAILVGRVAAQAALRERVARLASAIAVRRPPGAIPRSPPPPPVPRLAAEPRAPERVDRDPGPPPGERHGGEARATRACEGQHAWSDAAAVPRRS